MSSSKTNLKEFILHHDQIMQVNEFSLPGLNSSMLFGESAFVSFRTRRGKVAHYSEHMERLVTSSEYLDFDTDSDFWDDVQDSILDNMSKYPEHYFRVTVFSYLDGSVDFFIWVKELGEIPAAKVKLKTMETERPLFYPEVKIGNYAPIFKLGRSVARDYPEYDEFLLTDKNKFIFEGATSNFFCVKDGKIISPSFDTGVYKGIFISQLIRKMENKNWPREIKNLSLDEVLKEGYSCFLCNSVKGVSLVTQIDEHQINFQQKDIDYLNDYLSKVEGYEQISFS